MRKRMVKEWCVVRAMWNLHRFTADCAQHTMRCRLTTSLHSRLRHSCRRVDSLLHRPPLGCSEPWKRFEDDFGSCVAQLVPPGRRWVCGDLSSGCDDWRLYPCLSNANSVCAPPNYPVPTCPTHGDNVTLRHRLALRTRYSRLLGSGCLLELA